MSKKVMKLINPSTGLMECKICGSRHMASIKPRSNGRYYRGSWQCINKCKFDAAEKRPEQTKKRL